jgi:hypothetical protein
MERTRSQGERERKENNKKEKALEKVNIPELTAYTLPHVT